MNRQTDRHFMMTTKRLLFTLVLICGLGQMAIGQKRPDLSRIPKHEDKIDAWRNYCNVLLGYGDAGVSDSKLLIAEARYGIKLCLPTEFRRHAMFFLFTGCAFEKLKQYDSAAYYLEKSLALASKVHAANYEITALSRLNYVYDYSRNVAMRNETLNRMKKIADTSKSLETRQLSVDALGGYYVDVNDYEKAIKYKLEAIELYKQLLKTDTLITSTRNIGYGLTNLANLYNSLGRNEKAIQYLNEAKEYIGDMALREGEESLYIGYIQSYLGMENLDSANVYYQLIYKKMIAGDSLYNVLSTANRLYGDYYLEKNQIQKAYHHAQLAVTSARKSEVTNDLIRAKILFGSVLYRQQKYAQAIQFLRPVLDDSFDFDKEALADIHHTLARSYAALKQWEHAYHYLYTYSGLNDTLQLAAANKNFNEIEGKYQNTQKIQQLKVKNLQLNEARKERLWLLAGLAMLLIVALLLMVIYRNKKHTADVLDEKNRTLARLNNDLEVANQTKAKLFSIISHDLRSPISQVYQYLKLQQHNPQLHTEAQKIQLSSKIQEATGTLLETMEDLLLWSKTQMNHFNPVFERTELLTVVQQCLQLLKLNSDSKGMELRHHLTGSTPVVTDPYFLQTIVRNLLQNAIKAAPEHSVIEIKCEQQDNQLRLQISNKGKVFGQQEYESLLKNEHIDKGLSGLGLRLVDELALKLGLSVRFIDTGGSTTTAEILFPKN